MHGSRQNLEDHLRRQSHQACREIMTEAKMDELFTKPKKPKVDLKIPCEICGTTFKKRYSLKVHMQKQHTEGGRISHYCSICGKGNSSAKQLKKHMAHVHENVSKDKVLVVPYM